LSRVIIGSFFALSADIGLTADFDLNYLPGAIPMLNQVMSATRGATDAFSGVSRHVNDSVSQTHLFICLLLILMWLYKKFLN
jgi:hypothetical protein